jgi:hypothetical protein
MTECCSNLFTDFTFEDLTNADPPDEKGVYVIKVKSKSEVPPIVMIEKTRQLLLRLNWNLVIDFIMSRVERLSKIGNCPLIYIGSAGGQRGSKNTLRGRYREFSLRHTAMYPIWVLLYFNWKLEFGWKESINPKREENELKIKYRKLHNGRLPAIVER